MDSKEKRFYTRTHEWIRKIDETTVLAGLSQHAVDEMGDLVFINLPGVGKTVTAGEVMADVESVKAVSDIYSPVSGVVAEVNGLLTDAPEKLNEAPYESWIVRISSVTAYAELMDEAQYAEFIRG
jgi:glycine cleavage system H protein